MAVPARHPLMTAEQLFELPDDGYRSELVEGEIVRMTPSGGTHGIVAMRMGVLLSEYVEAHRLGVCFAAETGFLLQRDPDTVRAPDVAFVAAGRIPSTGIPTFYWPSAPDLAVEVLSPWDRPAEVRRKVAEYFAAGTRLVWIIDPAAHGCGSFSSAAQPVFAAAARQDPVRSVNVRGCDEEAATGTGVRRWYLCRQRPLRLSAGARALRGRSQYASKRRLPVAA